MENVRERVNRVVARQFHVDSDRVTETARIDEDLGALSLDRVEVVMALEDEFAIDISDSEAAKLHTVGDVLACVTEQVRKRQADGLRH
jgi:acyl carrier protein